MPNPKWSTKSREYETEEPKSLVGKVFKSIEGSMSRAGQALGSPTAQIVRDQDEERAKSKKKK